MSGLAIGTSEFDWLEFSTSNTSLFPPLLDAETGPHPSIHSLNYGQELGRGVDGSYEGPSHYSAANFGDEGSFHEAENFGFTFFPSSSSSNDNAFLYDNWPAEVS